MDHGRLHGRAGERDGIQTHRKRQRFLPRFRVSSAPIFNRPGPTRLCIPADLTISTSRSRVRLRTSVRSGRSLCTTTTRSIRGSQRVPHSPTGPLPRRRQRSIKGTEAAATLQAPLWQGNSFGQDNDAADNDPEYRDPDPPAHFVSAALRPGFQLDRRVVQHPALRAAAGPAMGSERAIPSRGYNPALLWGSGCQYWRADVRLHDGRHQRRDAAHVSDHGPVRLTTEAPAASPGRPSA